MPLFEKHRPRQWSDVVGQERVLRQIDIIRSQGSLEGRAYFLSGPSGSGKTTIAKLIAEEVTGKHGTIEIDAQRLNTEMLREFERYCWFRPIGANNNGGHCFIVNEIHGLSGKIVSELQTILEARHVQKNSTWVFTTTNKGQQRMFDTKHDAIPFLSRCVKLEMATLKDNGLAFAAYAQRVAQSESLDGRPLSFYIALVKREDGNMRSVMQAIESGECLLETQAELEDQFAASLSA